MVATAAQRGASQHYHVSDRRSEPIEHRRIWGRYLHSQSRPHGGRRNEVHSRLRQQLGLYSFSIQLPDRSFAGNSHSKLYAEAVGGKENQGLPNFNVALERDKMNVGNVLREAGYTTGFVGKFHLTSELDFPEFYKGKNKWINIPKDASPGPETSAQFKHNERWMRRYLETLGFSWAKNVYPENVRSPYSMHNPEWTTAAALEFIEENKDGPFYLHLCSTLLHGPDRSWRKSMDHPLITGEGEVESLPEVMTPRAKSFSKQSLKKVSIPTAMWLVKRGSTIRSGRFSGSLKELGIDDNTLVIFAPDHGRDGKGIRLFTRRLSSAHDHALAERNPRRAGM